MCLMCFKNRRPVWLEQNGKGENIGKQDLIIHSFMDCSKALDFEGEKSVGDVASCRRNSQGEVSPGACIFSRHPNGPRIQKEAVAVDRVVGAFFFLSLFILRERERESGGGSEREGERERIPSRLHAVSTEPDVGLDPTNHEITT